MTHVVIIDHCELNQTYNFKDEKGEWHNKGTTTWQKMIISNKGVEYY